jgi:hypothetical protein
VAIISGTQINFAIPGAFVKQVLDGRVSGSEIGIPYASAGETRLPVRLTTLDPLGRARDVKVEFWAGSPGTPRPATLRKPEPAAGDGSRQSVVAQLRGEGYLAEVPLPALPAGQVTWIQPVLVNAAGASHWGEAVSYRHDPGSVLERKDVVLGFKGPDKPAERTLRMTSKEAATLYMAGKSLRRSEQMDADALESARPDPTGTHIILTMARPRFSKEFGGRTLIAPPQLGAHTARFAPRLVVGLRGEIRAIVVPRDFNVVPPPYREAVGDFFETVSNTWQMTTVPLPNKETKPGEAWTARIPWLVVTGKTKESYALVLTCTYEGLRTSQPGRNEAYIRLSGVVKGPKKSGDKTLGKVSGHALFDVDKGFHREVKALISSETDTGDSKVRVLVTDERTVTREEGNTRGIKPATDNPGPKPSGGLPKLVIGGDASVGKTFRLTIQMTRPPAGTKVTLNPAPGLMVVGDATKPVPLGPDNLPVSVTWMVRAMRQGNFRFTATLSSGTTIRGQVTVQPNKPG